jgi:superoxide oxidase
LPGYALIGLHAAAALLHHYLLRDNTRKLMLSGTRAAGRQGRFTLRPHSRL